LKGLDWRLARFHEQIVAVLRVQLVVTGPRLYTYFGVVSSPHGRLLLPQQEVGGFSTKIASECYVRTKLLYAFWMGPA
jgi:hypothetical protein